MHIKKSNGKVYGAEFTKAELKAIEMEARRALAEYERKNAIEIEAIVIRQLRRLTGWGETRLKRFYDGFDDELNKLIERYEMTEEDSPWLCTMDLKREGFDIEQWHKEKYPNEGNKY